MLNILISIIPKSVNVILFSFGCLGLFLCLKRNLKHIVFYRCSALLIVLMITWRVCFKILSSRYAIILIYPYSFSAALLFSILFSSKQRISGKIGNILICLASIAIIAILVNWTKKNYSVSRITNNFIAISDTIKKYNKNEKQLTFIVNYDDYPRFRQRTGLRNVVKKEEDFGTKGLQEAYNQLNIDCINPVVETVTQKNDIANLTKGLSPQKYEHLLSVFTQKNKKKKYDLFYLETDSYASLTSPSNKKDLQNNLLINGDIELLDSIDVSFKKMTSHIPNYSEYHVLDENIKTPENAYFYNGVSSTHTLPFFSCTDQNPLSGKNSVHIKTPLDYAFIFFEQEFRDKADYSYSLILKGKPDTIVCIFYYSYYDKKCVANRLCYFTIPDEKIYKLTGFFSYDPIGEDSYFIVGAWIRQGEVYLDNFAVKTNEQLNSQFLR